MPRTSYQGKQMVRVVPFLYALGKPQVVWAFVGLGCRQAVLELSCFERVDL